MPRRHSHHGQTLTGDASDVINRKKHAAGQDEKKRDSSSKEATPLFHTLPPSVTAYRLRCAVVNVQSEGEPTQGTVVFGTDIRVEAVD